MEKLGRRTLLATAAATWGGLASPASAQAQGAPDPCCPVKEPPLRQMTVRVTPTSTEQAAVPEGVARSQKRRIGDLKDCELTPFGGAQPQ